MRQLTPQELEEEEEYRKQFNLRFTVLGEKYREKYDTGKPIE